MYTSAQLQALVQAPGFLDTFRAVVYDALLNSAESMCNDREELFRFVAWTYGLAGHTLAEAQDAMEAIEAAVAATWQE